jgi:hypothetical protein
MQFVREVSAEEAGRGANAITLTINEESLGETMPEMEPPPADLVCIQAVPGAFYCGFSPASPKTVMFSNINLLYSWPMEYRYDVGDSIVTLAVAGNTVYALTDGCPYTLSGTAPESMTVSKIAGPAACVSARGVCVYRNSVYFVSNSGLMTVGSADEGLVCSNVTNGVFTKEQWEAMNPESCVMGLFDDALHLFFTAKAGETFGNGSRHIGLVIDMTEAPSIAVTTHDEAARCVCVDERSDKMYFVRAQEGG